MVFDCIFGVAARPPKPPIGVPLAEIQLSLREALGGCHGVRADRLLFRIDSARTPAELWGLRIDLHQCIAQVHTENAAALRINNLNHVFAGWVPAAQLIKIQLDFKPPKR